MGKMIVLLNLLEKNDNYVVYEYGYDNSELNGKIKVYKNKEKSYQILSECKDIRVGRKGTLWAISQIIKMLNNNDLKETVCFQS